MSTITPPSVARAFYQNGDIYLANSGNADLGVGSLYLTDSNAELYNPGNTNLAKTLINLTNGNFLVNGTGSNGITFNVPGAISQTAAASSTLTTSSGSLTLSATNTTTGSVLIQGNSTGPDTVKLFANNATSGQVSIVSSGASTSTSAILLSATGTTGGGIALNSACGSSSVKSIGLTASDTTNGTISLSAAGNFTSSIPAIQLSATNTTSGQVNITSASNSTSIPALLFTGTSSTGGGIHIISSGSGAGNGSIYLSASNSSTGQVNVNASGTSSSAFNVSTPNGGQNFSATGAISITTSNTSSGISIATGTAGVPVTIGTTGSVITLNGNIVANGSFDEFRPTNTMYYDNIITVNGNPTQATGGDAGLAVRRAQQPNAAGLGDSVNTSTPKLSGTFQSGSATPGTLVLDASTASMTSNYLTGWWIKITSGTANNVVRRIKTFTPASQTAAIYLTADNTTTPTFNDGLDLTAAPAAGDTYELYRSSYETFTYNEVADCFETRGATIDPSSTTISSGNYTPSKQGVTTIVPRTFDYVKISASGTTISVTLNAHGVSVGDYIRVANAVTSTGSITAGVYTVASVTNSNVFTFTNGTSVTTSSSSNLSVTLLETSVLNVNKILVQDTSYNNGVVNIGNLVGSTSVTITKTNSGSGAGVNIPLGTTGAFYVKVFDTSGSGASATFAISTTGTAAGNVVRVSQSKGSDGQRINMVWTGGAQPILFHDIAGSGTGSYTYKATWM